jgi:hypothetical protein
MPAYDVAFLHANSKPMSGQKNRQISRCPQFFPYNLKTTQASPKLPMAGLFSIAGSITCDGKHVNISFVYNDLIKKH